MSDTGLKVFAALAGVAGLGMAGAVIAGVGKQASRNPDIMERGEILPGVLLRAAEKTYLASFAKRATDKGLPRPEGEILGCGAFGCVWPTTKPGVVLKATQDQEEVRVAQLLMSSDHPPEGFVRYFHRDKDQGFDLLWREEIAPARCKGWRMLDLYNAYSKTAREESDWAVDLNEWKELVDQLAADMSGWKIGLSKRSKRNLPVVIGERTIDLASWDPSDDPDQLHGMRFVVAWRGAILAAEELRKVEEARPIAEAILWAMSKGVMLADVMPANIGKAERDGKTGWVIFDPGYTVCVPGP